MKFSDITPFSYGGIFGLITGKLLYKSIKYAHESKKASDPQEKEIYKYKSKWLRNLAGISALSGLSGLLLQQEAGPMPFNSLMAGEGFGSLLGFYLTSYRDNY